MVLSIAVLCYGDVLLRGFMKKFYVADVLSSHTGIINLEVLNDFCVVWIWRISNKFSNKNNSNYFSFPLLAVGDYSPN